MKRAEWLQETRRMRFEEANGGWQSGRLTQEQATRLLGVCDRTFRRYIDRYEDEGLDGLIDKRLNQVSHRRAPVDEVMRLVDRYRSRHEGWNAKHFYACTAKGRTAYSHRNTQQTWQMTWNQVYRDGGLKWEKVVSFKPPPGIDAVYSLRITQARRATAYRDGEFTPLLTIASD